MTAPPTSCASLPESLRFALSPLFAALHWGNIEIGVFAVAGQCGQGSNDLHDVTKGQVQVRSVSTHEHIFMKEAEGTRQENVFNIFCIINLSMGRRLVLMMKFSL